MSEKNEIGSTFKNNNLRRLETICKHINIEFLRGKQNQ